MTDEKQPLSSQAIGAVSQKPRRGEIWQHVKRGTLYRVLHLGFYEPTGEELVIYVGLEKGAKVWARTRDVFCDGRFVRTDGLDSEYLGSKDCGKGLDDDCG